VSIKRDKYQKRGRQANGCVQRKKAATKRRFVKPPARGRPRGNCTKQEKEKRTTQLCSAEKQTDGKGGPDAELGPLGTRGETKNAIRPPRARRERQAGNPRNERSARQNVNHYGSLRRIYTQQLKTTKKGSKKKKKA